MTSLEEIRRRAAALITYVDLLRADWHDMSEDERLELIEKAQEAGARLTQAFERIDSSGGED